MTFEKQTKNNFHVKKTMFRKVLCRRGLKFILTFSFVYFVILNQDSRSLYKDSEQNVDKLTEHQEILGQNGRNGEKVWNSKT